MRNPIIVTQSPRYSFEERNAAVESLRKSHFFLLLGLGELHWEGAHNPPPPVVLSTCSKLNAVLTVVQLVRKKEKLMPHGGDNARVLLELKGRHSPKSLVTTANRIVSAIGGLFSFVHHSICQELTPHQLPKELIQGTQVRVEQLEELEARTGRDVYSHENIRVRLGSCVMIPTNLAAAIFYLLPFVLQSEDLFNACLFFRSCLSEFSLMDGVVRRVLEEPKRGPENEIERLALEHVVLQSFRTIESVVGEPGKDAKRFHARLHTQGIDPNELVGFPRRRKYRLEARIRWLQEARDSAAAHGKRRRQDPFTLFEAMEAQHLAHLALDRALWSMADSLGREGDESELAYLLETMFLDDPGWARNRTLFQGQCAVELARTPGGLVKICRYHEQQGRLSARRFAHP